MDFHSSKSKSANKYSVNNNSRERQDQTDDSNEHSAQSSREHSGDRNGDLFNLQRLAIKHERSPFPDFQFGILDNEADTDDNGFEFSLATGTRRKPPKRADSWEDNWLFQKRKPNTRTVTDGRNTLMSTKIYNTIDEKESQATEDNDQDDFDASGCSGNCKPNEVCRVERPCVRTSSSSSDVDNSEKSDTFESPCRNVESPGDMSEDKIPILEGNLSTPESSDSAESNEQFGHYCAGNHPESAQSSDQYFSKKGKNENYSRNSSAEDIQQREEKECTNRVLKAQYKKEVSCSGSLKDNVNIHQEGNQSCSQTENRPLPKLLVECSNPPRPVSGSRSCVSEDSSSDEFEKKAAAYKTRRRASWCPLETPVMVKRRGKRRPLLPLRVDEDEQELEMKVAPLATDEEAFIGLERQMLQRDPNHSSFRAKKASPNFVLNPLFVPEGDGAHNPREHDLFEEPVAMQNLQPSRSESGYSSCSPDSLVSHNNLHLPQGERNHNLRVRNPSNPTEPRLQDCQRGGNSRNEYDSSFLW